MLAKICGILALVWFFITAKNNGGPQLNWSVIGVIGYWLSWFLSKELIFAPLLKMMNRHTQTEEMLLMFAPVAVALLACFFIRRHLLLGLPGKVE
jgi:Kef-type K+ transport system membrane component KefB